MIDMSKRDQLLRKAIARVLERDLSEKAMADIICQTADGDDLTDEQLREDAAAMHLEFKVRLTTALEHIEELGLA